MFQTMDVSFEATHLVHCKQCKALLFSLQVVDSLLKFRPTPPHNYLILHPHLTPDSLHYAPELSLHQPPPFNYIYQHPVTCIKCHHHLGHQVKSINQHMRQLDIMDRTVIDIKDIKVDEGGVDYTRRIEELFDEDFNEEDKTEEQQQETKKSYRRRSQRSISRSKNKEQQKQKTEQPLKSRITAAKKYLQTSNTNTQLFEEMLASFDYMCLVVDELTQRVSHVEDVCKVMKKKVETVIPHVRK